MLACCCGRAGSGGIVKERILMVGNNTYHPEHFKCTECEKPIEGEYMMKDDKGARMPHARCSRTAAAR